jgi:hypothetical protein
MTRSHEAQREAGSRSVAFNFYVQCHTRNRGWLCEY